MLSFTDFYLSEKTISTREPIETKDDETCIVVGQKLADRFDLKLNGWQEFTFMFTIPDGVPDGRNTFTAKNEEEIIEKLKSRFSKYLEYIMAKKFPDGYSPDPSLEKEPPIECEPLDLEQLKSQMNKGK